VAGTTQELTVRERLLAAADELFYAEGIHTVGIDRVLEHAGVAKASLYGTFGSKDELVRAYLEERGRKRNKRIVDRIAQHDDPRDRILAVFDVLGDTASQGSFRGCAFVNACAERDRGSSPAKDVSARQREWLRELFAQLAADVGVPDPKETARELGLLYDGATIVAAMDGDVTAPQRGRALAAQLLDAHRDTARKGATSKRSAAVHRGRRGA
jgi:AcrR family transcriptional regulator